jgi:hypothetical protein
VVLQIAVFVAHDGIRESSFFVTHDGIRESSFKAVPNRVPSFHNVDHFGRTRRMTMKNFSHFKSKKIEDFQRLHQQLALVSLPPSSTGSQVSGAGNELGTSVHQAYALQLEPRLLKLDLWLTSCGIDEAYASF